MLALLLAHTGHWYVGALYLAPVTVLIITLLVIGHRDHRAQAQGLGRAVEDQDDDQGHRT